MKKFQLGFTLVEILVIVAIIGILASILVVGSNQSSSGSRDVQRQADLRIVSTALELYKGKYGRYPEGCNGAGNWSGHAPAYECSSGVQYIEGLVPEFLPRLPKDPKLNGDDSGYVYISNANGSAYKFIVKNTVEAETVGYGHQFMSCDVSNSSGGDLCIPGGPASGPRYDQAICDRLFTGNNCAAGQVGATPPECRPNNAQFQTSYGIWGGFSDRDFLGNDISPNDSLYRVKVERATELIVCAVP